MKRFKKLFILAIFIAFVSMFLFIGATEKGEEKAGRPVIAYVMLGTQTPYVPPLVAEFHRLANENGWDDILYDAKFDAALQASQMDDAIAMRPDIIDLVALDATAMASGIKKAYDAGIMVLMDHTKANPEDEQYTVGYTGPDNYLEGVACAELMNDALGGKGKVVMIEGASGQEAQINRAQGFIDRLEELNSEIEIIARQTAQWRKDLATQIMQDWVVRYGDEIDGVYGQDDTLAVGAWIALEEAGYKKGDLKLVGVGGSKEGLAAINDGIMYGTVMQSPVIGAQKAIATIKEIFDENLKVGDQLDPYFRFMDLPKVTKENVVQYLPGDW